MGSWRGEESSDWQKASSSSDSSLGLGAISELGNPNLNSGGGGGGDRCSTRRIVKSHCGTEEVEPGKFVRKCMKTEQLLRFCVGRPVEVVESNSEYTEDDVTEDMARGSLPFESFPHESSLARLGSEIEAKARSMFGDSSRCFFEAAEEIKNGFSQALGLPMEPPPFNRQRSMDGMFEEASKKKSDSPYSEFFRAS
ncbi:hypothetical protein ACLOJK_040721 [Asimina triloba]